MNKIEIASPKPGYRSQSQDRSAEADAAYYYFLRQKPLEERIGMTQRLIRMAKRLTIASVQRQYPDHPPMAIKLKAARQVLGERYGVSLPFIPGGALDNWQEQDSITLTQGLHQLFGALGIPYYLGGGLAAAIWGEPRVTQDANIVLQFPIKQLDLLVSRLSSAGFYCPPGGVEEIRMGMSNTLSVTQMQTVDSADLIKMPEDDPFERSQMDRRILVEDLGAPFWVCTAEDIILQKLLWSRNSQSQEQWRHILGVLKGQAQALDYGYLTDWAERIGQSQRLTQAFLEAGL